MSEVRKAVAGLEEHGLRLDRALARLFPDLSRSVLARLIENGNVLVDTKQAAKTSQRIAAGSEITLSVPPAEPASSGAQNLPISVLHEDSDMVVIDKPPGIVVHPSAGHREGTLVNALLFHVKDLSGIGGELRPGIVHRLDKDTSGVMVIAKHDAAHRALTAAWSTDAVRKEYLALLYGRPRLDRGTVSASIGRDPGDRKRMSVVSGGRSAITDYEVVEQLRFSSLVRCRLRTGRTHQIRVHMKHLGHPIVGDPVYSGPQWRGIPDKKIQKVLSGVARQMLHAEKLTVPHPRTGELLTFVAPVPEDMARVIEALR